ncbi:unnamed protein product [Durusdinium trenchii]|uniref:SMP-30/Gluconolactonase/LRE-like region domain-containing protein n=1 Tax=Durusdinium trenchii TaxID=1381693 RepID=A0ABP0R9A1_9DINO
MLGGLLAAFATLRCAVSLHATTRPRYIYLILNFPNRIVRTDINGQNQVVLLEGLGHPHALAVDDFHRKMYFGVSDDASDRLMRSDLTGRNAEELVQGVHVGGVAVDPHGGAVYWTELDQGLVQRARLDGSQVETLVSGLEDPGGLDLDLHEGQVFWCDQTGWERRKGRIQRSWLNGSNVTDLRETPFPMDVAVDLAHQQLYYTDAGSYEITRCDFTGAECEVILNKTVEVNESAKQGRHINGLLDPHGIVLDHQGKIYFTLLGTAYRAKGGASISRNAKLQRCNLDGSHLEILAEFGSTQPVSIALSTVSETEEL